MSALRVLDFSSSAIDSIWAMTAFILHLGNVQFFNDENDTAGIRNMDLVDKVGCCNSALSRDPSQKQCREIRP